MPTIRRELAALAGQLGRDGEWARQLSAALAALKAKGGAPAEIRTLATELALLAGDRLADRTTAERAWLAVLEVEADATDAFDALSAVYRVDQRWMDLRALLERRTEVTIDERARLAALLQLAVLEDQMLGEPARAIAAYRRALELDPANVERVPGARPAVHRRQAVDRARGAARAARGSRSGAGAGPRVSPRRAVRACPGPAEPRGRSARGLVARQRGHADGRELLEELLAATQRDPAAAAQRMRISRVLEPLYERTTACGRTSSACCASSAGSARAPRRSSCCRGSRGSRSPSSATRAMRSTRGSSCSGSSRRTSARGASCRGSPRRCSAGPRPPRRSRPRSRRRPRATSRPAARCSASSRPTTIPSSATPRARSPRIAACSMPASRRRRPRRAPVPRSRGSTSKSRAWPELRDVMRRQAEWAADVSRAPCVARAGGPARGGTARAPATRRSRRGATSSHDQPNDAGALYALERLYSGAERWRDLIDVLRRTVDLGLTTDQTIAVLGRIAEILEQQLAEPDEATAAWLEVLDQRRR